VTNTHLTSAARPNPVRKSFTALARGTVLLATLSALAHLGCSAAEDPAEQAAILSATAALDASTVIATSYDDSASPVHIQIRACKSDVPAATHQVDCRVNAEYAVIGGGVLPQASGGNGAKPFVTESRPSDGRTWRASSGEASSLAHDLTTYAIGLRLDGVSTQKLRDAIGWKTSTTTSSAITVTADSGKVLLGGGALTAPNTGVTGSRVLTGSAWSGSASWNAQSRSQAGSVAGTTQITLLQIDKKVIEGFGALEVMNRSGSTSPTSGGTQTTTLGVSVGWALLSPGAIINTTSGTPRRITSIVPSSDGRTVTVSSGDQSGSSAGSTTPYLTQVRKKPGSHGLCNAGSALASNTDSCVTSICAARSQCCSTSWDSTCVSMVTSTCGRSCAADTCVRSSFELVKWQKPDGNPVASNCYYYAQNKYPDAQDPNGDRQDPGYQLGPDPTDFTPERLIALAAGDGLIPSSFSAVCPDNRSKVMFTCNSNPYNYHWLRQDIGGAWSQKYGTIGQAQIAQDVGVRPYTDVQSNTHQAFFCACQRPLPATP
jgi:hypothetical protein